MSLMNILAQGVLAQVTKSMGPQGNQLASIAMQFINQQGNGQAGAGMNNLLGMFEQNGLGDIAKSWVGTGPNQSINPQQIMQAFGQNNMQNIAQQMGVDPAQASNHLSQILPDLINQLTPNGQIDGNAIGQMMQQFLGQKAA